MSFVRLILFFTVVCVASLVALAQSPDPIVAAVEAENWQTARSEINKVRSANEAQFRDKNYEYLLGRIAERTGETATALASYQAIASNDSKLREYALWRLAKLARATGDLVLERERLQQLVAAAPSSLLFEPATLRLSESFFESGDFSGAANSAKPLTLSKNSALVREATTLIGLSYLRAGKTTEARDVFTKLLMQMPDASRPDDFALEAVRQLDALDNKTPTLAEVDLLLRASVYQFNRDFAGARFHYQAVVDRFPHSTTVPNAMFQIARGLYNEAKYDDAVKLFQKVVDGYQQSTSARDAVGFLGSSYVRMKRTDDAVAAYKLLIDRFPDNPYPERAYLNIIDALHEAGRYPEALNWVQQTRARFKADLANALALFAQLRIHMAQGSWATVVRDADELSKLSDLGGTRVPGGTNPVEVNFLRAYALEQLGRTEEAINAYLAIPDGRNEYYGTRATQKLLDLAGNEKSRTLVRMRLNNLQNESKVNSAAGQFEQARVAAQSSLRLTNDPQQRAEALKYLQSAYSALSTYRVPQFSRVSLLKQDTDLGPHDALANSLLLLGLYDEAIPEYLAARKTSRGPDEDYTIAVLSLRGGIANRAVRFGEQIWKTVPADFVIELAPREMVQLLYPAPFRESLLKHTSSRNVDPRFVLSIARQESRFQTDAKSIAAARGMMQFIASTANEIAAQIKLNNFNQDDLYNADTAILFGSQYLSNLFQQFPNQPQAVAGSYNGGADNLARWIARSRANEPDRYVAEIGFTQTKDYVYKVMANYWTYQRLYDAQLQPATSK
ncbi:MAG TPA: transglycosylase SLT domain-containing protein [Pyrinomonadaceae bacterium]|jgi:soluble lytic murein transglycosylase|nr:transglycosylase SLT domain-containing protein [Pyrinomonadaceae bacterium]